MDRHNSSSVAILAMAVSWVVFRVTDVVCPPPEHLKGKDWYWRWIVVTFLYGSFSGISVLYCFFENPEMFDDLVNSTTLTSYNLVSVAIGYFACDVLDLFVYSPEWWFKSLLGHHAVAILGGAYCLYIRKYVPFAASLYFMEINNIFLNFHRILREMPISESSKLYRANMLLNIITCAIFRVCFSFWMMSTVIRHWRTISSLDLIIGISGSSFFIHQNAHMFNRSWKAAFGKSPAC